MVSEDLIRHPVAVRAHVALVEVGDPLAARPHHHVAVRVAARAPEDGDVALERRGGGLVRADDFEAVVQEEVDARISVAPAVWQAAGLECGFDVLGAIANRPRVCVLDERLHRFVDVQSAVLSVGLAAGAARVGLREVLCRDVLAGAQLSPAVGGGDDGDLLASAVRAGSAVVGARALADVERRGGDVADGRAGALVGLGARRRGSLARVLALAVADALILAGAAVISGRATVAPVRAALPGLAAGRLAALETAMATSAKRTIKQRIAKKLKPKIFCKKKNISKNI